MKLIAVVVTYNRKHLLPFTLDGLLAQTYKIDQIIIVDNASNDGTEELVRGEYLHNKNIIYYKLQKNTGGSGGFCFGMEKAYELGADWIWVMDDDVKPVNDGLAKMLSYKDKSLVIHPSKIDVKSKFIWADYGTKDFIFWGIPKFLNYNNVFQKKDFVSVGVCCFEGMLINRKVIDKIGFPDPDLFICDDDTEYGYRIGRAGFKNIYISYQSLEKTIHLLPIKKTSSIVGDWKVYYMVRNRIFMYKKYGTFLTTILILPLYLLYIIKSKILFSGKKGIKTIPFFFKGLVHGFKSIKGKF